jgi:hypothetical protein
MSAGRVRAPKREQENFMGKRYVSNDTAQVIFVGGLMIPPGDGREVDETLLPPLDEQPQPADETLPDPDANLRELLTASVKNIVPALADLGDETLASLARIEGESVTPRKGVLSAIAELQLLRAQAKTGPAE